MWRADKVLWLLVGPEKLEWQVVGGAPGSEVAQGAVPLTPDAGLAEVVAALGGVATACGGTTTRCRAVHVIVWDGWLAQDLVPWSREMLRPGSARTYVMRQLRFAGHEIAETDRLCMDEAPYGQPRWAVVYGDALVEAAQQLAKAVGVSSVSVVSASAQAWALHRAWRGEHTSLAVVAKLNALWVYGQKHLQGVLLRRLPDAVCAGGRDVLVAELAAGWQRLRLRDPAIPAQSVNKAVKAALAPWSRVTRSPLQWSSRPASRLTQALVAMALVMVVAVLGDAAVDWRTLRSAERELSKVSAEAAQPIAQVREPMSREESVRQQAAERALKELDVPVRALLRALEPPADIHVAVLSVEWQRGVDGEGAERGIRLEAEGQSVYDMTRYAAFLAERDPLVGARLVQHEIKPGSVPTLRFTLNAGWRQP